MRYTYSFVLLSTFLIIFTHIPSFSDKPWDFFSVHAFDHLDNLDKQAEPAYLCGAFVIYTTGVGVCGYMGIPPVEEWEKTKKDVQEYVQHAKSFGIPIVLGYLCSTSIVGLKTFDQNWLAEFKRQFSSPPQDWLQQDIKGKVLPSWYGGEYNPACMNNPDWRKYQKFMVKTSLELGLDGIFFDNPTVHPEGCYCPYCMGKFLQELKSKGENIEDTSLPSLRTLAQNKSEEFKKFRCTIARDFFAEIRDYAKGINPKALITANNSLNSPEVIFSQCHTYGYNIKEMSKAQDFVVIEDMQSTPRRKADETLIECSPVYDLVHSIIHSKPLVAVTIADGNYHTPPHLTNLALFEAFTRDTNYMLWPTWENAYREKMIQTISPFVQWLKHHAPQIAGSKHIYEVLVYFPFDKWLYSTYCKELEVLQQLVQRNIPYMVASEENFEKYMPDAKIIMAEKTNHAFGSNVVSLPELCEKSNKIFIDISQKSYIKALEKHLSYSSLKIKSNRTIRGVIKQNRDTTFVLLYNLDIEYISTYQDKIFPANDVSITVPVIKPAIKKILLSTPNKEQEIANYEIKPLKTDLFSLNFHIPELILAGIVTIN